MDSLLWAVTGPVTAVVLASAQRLFRAGAESAAKTALSEQLRGEFAQFKVELMESFNGSYRRTSECRLIEAGVSQRLDSIDSKMQEFQTYAHECARAEETRRARRGEA